MRAFTQLKFAIGNRTRASSCSKSGHQCNLLRSYFSVISLICLNIASESHDHTLIDSLNREEHVHVIMPISRGFRCINS